MHDEILKGLANGELKKGTFTVSRENYREANVRVDDDISWFISGRYCNRAVNGDIVALKLLPENQWIAPEKALRLRDAEDLVIKVTAIVRKAATI